MTDCPDCVRREADRAAARAEVAVRDSWDTFQLLMEVKFERLTLERDAARAQVAEEIAQAIERAGVAESDWAGAEWRDVVAEFAQIARQIGGAS